MRRTLFCKRFLFRAFFFVFATWLQLAAAAQGIATPGLTRYVDPFIGVDDAIAGSGSVFAGATVPFGMVKLGPDCDYYTATAGYASGKPVFGFSHTHASGTGGGPSYGNILLMDTTGAMDINDHSSPASDEMSSPGYFRVLLKRYNITAELTATARTGFHQYTFPVSGQANILLDAGSFLGLDTTWGEQQVFAGAEIRLLSDTSLEGYSRVGGGWNLGLPYTVYFYARFDKPAARYGTWKSNLVHPGNKEEFDSGEKTGAYFSYTTEKGQRIKVKVGISYLSCSKAKANLEKENEGWDFDQVRQRAVDDWNKDLSTVLVEGSEENKKIFYTALYHTMLMVDKTGENPKWISAEPNYDDFYTIWDTHRCGGPLLTLLMASRQRDIIRSMIDIYRHEGYMPDGRMGNENGRTQGGSDAEVVIADAFVKGMKGIDYETAYLAMIKDAETPPGGDERKQGRGGIPDYNTLGYVSTRYERAGNRTLEYANDDRAIACVAKGLGKMEDYRKYMARAGNWKNLWRDSISSMGARGFIWPRNVSGEWVDTLFECDGTHVTAKKQHIKFDVFREGSFPNFFYEGNSWEYSFFVPQDVRGLIMLCGGKRAFIARLDTFFYKNVYQVGNEPDFLVPTMYTWAGRPDKTAFMIDPIRRRYYHASRSVIPGNDDAGAMSSFYAFHAMGIYPNAGQDVYLITSPVFSSSTIHMENGKVFTIIAHHLTPENIYIQSAKLNDKQLVNAWFRHSDIKEGGTLELIMGPHPSSWGRNTPPPSLSDQAD